MDQSNAVFAYQETQNREPERGKKVLGYKIFVRHCKCYSVNNQRQTVQVLSLLDWQVHGGQSNSLLRSSQKKKQ